MPMTPRAIVDTTACATEAMSAIPISVRDIEQMTSHTRDLTCLLCGEALTTQDVRARCNGFQMGRLHATPVPAAVVDLVTLGDRPFGKHIGQPMCQATLPKESVATTESGTAPDPTIARAIDVQPEEGGQREHMIGVPRHGCKATLQRMDG